MDFLSQIIPFVPPAEGPPAEPSSFDLDSALHEIRCAASEALGTIDEAIGLLNSIEGHLVSAREALKPKAIEDAKLEAFDDKLGDVCDEADNVRADDSAGDVEAALDHIEDLVAAARGAIA
jgi:hypothetical protein